MIKNYYQILGIEINATKEEIKKAYKICATKFHPDKQHGDKFFEERFKEIKDAYDLLIDDIKRAEYDTNNNFKSHNHSSYTQEKIDSQQRTNEKEKRKKIIYYTSKNLVLSGSYINCNGKNYLLDDYDLATLRKDDGSNFIFIGIVFIIIGILTIAFFIGTFFLLYGIYALFFREYYIVLVSRNGDTALIKGRKGKMKTIVNKINKVIEESRLT